MAKFFRRLRQRFLANEQFRKYLLYATGETVLVVIGILIALSVNNHNERKKARQQSQLYLQDMQEDLATDTLYLGAMLRKLEEQLQLEEWLLTKSSFSLSDIDTIKLATNRANWAFYINDRSFQNMQNAAAKLAGYEGLYSDISKYYLVTKTRISQNNQLEQRATADRTAFEQVLRENLPLNARQYSDYAGFQVGVDLPSLHVGGNPEAVLTHLSQLATRNELYDRYARHTYLFLALSKCRIEAKALISEIDEKLPTD